MKIVKEFPPNFEKIKKAFNVEKNVAFCYGNKIYNPYEAKISDHVIIHESVHSEQQKDDPEGWWNKYIENPTFRITQEIEAYGAQLKFIRVRYGLDKAMQALHAFANAISSDVYGKVLDYSAGREAIRRYAYDLDRKVYS